MLSSAAQNSLVDLNVIKRFPAILVYKLNLIKSYLENKSVALKIASWTGRR